MVAWVSTRPVKLTPAELRSPSRRCQPARAFRRAWSGWNRVLLGLDAGLCNVPADLPPCQAIACGGFHTVALLVSGQIVCWGSDVYDQLDSPSGSGFVSIAAGLNHSVALDSSGEVTCWGANFFGESDVPDGLAGVTMVAAGNRHTLAVVPGSASGIVGWGSNTSNQLAVPAALATRTVVGLGAGSGNSIALDAGGVVHSWGDDLADQVTESNGLSIVETVSAGNAFFVMVAPPCDEGGPCQCEGDFNGDGVVNGADLTLLLNAWGTSNDGLDLDGDGLIGGADLTILLSNWAPC